MYFTIHPYEMNSDHPLMNEALLQIKAYFEGRLQHFNLPVEPAGTVFQRLVWDEVMKIPYGQTLSYSKLSLRCGDEKKVRAVAAANAANPLAIVIPCHRIIGSNGQLTGYAWGLERKEWLLRHEQSRSQLSFF